MPISHQPHSVRRSWRYRVVRTLIVLAVCYLGVIVVLALFENSMLYHPTTAAGEWRDQPDSRIQDIDLHTPRGDSVHAWWWPKEGAEGAVLYCHGNAGNLSHRAYAMADWRKQLNYSVLIFDYPGFGRSAGTPDEAGCYAAAGAAYDWLTAAGRVPADRVLIYGCSLGGGVAVDLASRVPHRALVLLSTFTSVPDRAQELFPWLPARWVVRNRFDNLGKIQRCTRPVFIAHGDNDEVVPFAHGEKLAAAANEPKCFLPLGHFGHYEDVDTGFFRPLRKFLSESAAIAGH
jgi:fermentation-respiration switch protein FrsA (DUF1100 family)